MEDVASPTYEIMSLQIGMKDVASNGFHDEDDDPTRPLMPGTTEEISISHSDLSLPPLTNSGEDESDKLGIEFKTETLTNGEMDAFELEQFVEDTDVTENASGEEVGSSVQLATLMKTEVVETEDGEMEADEEAAPQQYIILTRTADGGTEPVEVPSKYIRFDGADGQTYVLAVTDEMSTEASIKALPTQPIISAKNVKLGRKREASESSSVTASVSNTIRGKTGHNASVDGINQAWFTTRGDKNALQREGHEWKQGQWTKEEVDVLEANINSYCKDNNIKDPAEVIFEMSKDERKDFYRTIALGIHRPLFSVYRRVTRMYDRKNHRGKYTASEMKHLRVLRAKHGNDWAAIGVTLGRSASSVKDKCRLMKDNCKSGKWYPEEEERLSEAVYKLTGVKPSESITSGLSWASVAEHVGTRSEKQCRTKWLNYLNWKQQGGADWTRDDDQLLIQKVSTMNVNNDSEIDWEALSQDWKSVRSPQWLRGKWWALKRHIADYNKLSYSSLLEQMKQVIYWNLKPKASSRQAKVELHGALSSEVASVASTSDPAATEIFKNCIPVSLTSVDGSGALALSYCPSEDESFQTFEVLPHWRSQIIGTVTTQDGAVGQLPINREGHIIVQTLAPELAESIRLSGQQQVIISSAPRVSSDDGIATPVEGMTIQVNGGLVQTDQELSTLEGPDSIHETSLVAGFETGGEEIVTVSEFHEQPVTGDQHIMTHDVFETVTTNSGGDLVMCVASSTHASRIMTSLKDPILMSSSDVECEKSQSAELTDENTELD